MSDENYTTFLKSIEHDFWRMLGLLLAIVASCSIVWDRW